MSFKHSNKTAILYEYCSQELTIVLITPVLQELLLIKS